MKKQNRIKRIWITCLCMAAIPSLTLSAQDVMPKKDYTRGWYIGAQTSMPVAEADFSSFGADKFRPGWSAGIHAGYRFTSIWSMEMTANWGQLFLAEQDCCFDRGYFLGSDYNRYRDGYYLPSGMQGWYYKDLKSRTFVQRYGLQANMNILGIFNRTKDSRWRLELSPAIYAIGTSSDLMTKTDNTPAIDNLNDWHFGYGGQAQVSYAVAHNINIGIYGGFTQLTDKPLDGMSELHSTNFIIDAGVKLSFAISKVKGKKGKMKTDNTPAIIPNDTPVIVTDSSSVILSDSEESQDSLLLSSTSVQNDIVEIDDSTFPVIYFSFNSVWIEPSERAKVKQIADMMKADAQMRIRITGWSDGVGGEEANKRVSLQRAEAVKRVLGQWLISAERVETVGGGINRTAQNDTEARNATTIEITENR